jgi:simple sugar transport system permease protein/ribose transport system permease protein
VSAETIRAGGVLANIDRRKLIGPAVIGGAVVLLLLVGGILERDFLSYDNLLAVMRSASLVGIAAVGMTFITLTGNFVSLSTEQTAIISGILYALALSNGWPVLLAALVTFGAAMAIGLVQGAIVALGMNPIVTTLGAGAAVFGLANVLTNNRTVNTRTSADDWIGTARPLGIPTQVIAFVALTAITMLVLSRTRFGRRVMLMGANRAAATATGLKVAATTIIAFVLASAFCALCGIMVISQVGQAKTTNFEGFTIDVVAAVLVGGTAIQGGEGSTLRTAMGAIFIALLANFMLIRGYSYGVRLVITGVIVALAVVGFHLLRTRNAG